MGVMKRQQIKKGRHFLSLLFGCFLCLSLAMTQTAMATEYPDAESLIPKISESADSMFNAKAITDYQDHMLSGVSPRGTTINLFDYWLDSQDAKDSENPGNYTEIGINKDHVFKFGKGIGTEGNENLVDETTVNYWTGDAAPRTGIVKNQLVGGYPQLVDAIGGESLSYLFNGTDGTGKEAFRDVDGLLQIDDNGYYYYNSRENYAVFDESKNSFVLYDAPGVAARGTSMDGQFFPFNTATDVFGEQYGSMNVDSVNEVINHYFGLNMSTRFVQQYGGYVDENQSNQVTYNFSGDDDVWIFIDGILVGDLGGIHDASSIEINFATGRVYVYHDRNGNNQYDDGETIYNDADETLASIFKAAGVESGFSRDTFADDTYHTLDFFYLERGNTDSNMSLKYNLVNIPESGIMKIDENGDPVSGVTFNLYPTDASYDKLANQGFTFTGTTNNAGELLFSYTDDTGQSVPYSLEKLNNISDYWCLEETSTQAGYRNPGEIHLRFEKGMLLSSNPWDTGAYSQSQVTVRASDELYELNSAGEKGDAIQTTDDGFIFAVVLKNNGGTWYPVSGNAFDGWNVSDDSSMAGVIAEAKKDLYRFYPGSGGALEVDINNLPGDVTKYAYMINKTNVNPEAEYTIGYYYTTVSSIDAANTENTKRLYVNGDGTANTGFERVFSVTLNIANIKNELNLIKTTTDGTPIEDVTFTLYKDTNQNGLYDDGETSVNHSLTTNKMGQVSIVSDSATGILAHGQYVLVETDVPEGYLLDSTPIAIIVDDEGVHVNAGTSDDQVSVETNIGTLVWSMKGFAAGDKIDATLHDVVAQPQTTDAIKSDKWVNVDGVAGIHYQYDDDDTVLNYVLTGNTGDQSSYIATEGWSRLNITQCLDEDHETNESSGNIKQDLNDQVLNHLFTGEVTIHMTNQQVGSLRVEKTVDGNQAPDVEFTYTLNLENTGEEAFTITKYDSSNNQPVGSSTTIKNGEVFTLKNGQYVVIEDILAGTPFTVSEQSDERFDPSITGDASLTIENDGLTAKGEIKAGQQVDVHYTNTFAPSVVAKIQVQKTMKGRDWEEDYRFAIEDDPSDQVSSPLPIDPQNEIEISKPANGSSVNSAAFGNITYMNEGTYRYLVKEIKGSEDGVIYDTHTSTVTVNVSMVNSELVASVTYDNSNALTESDRAVDDAAAFTNTYAPVGTQLQVTKQLVGRDWLDSDEFEFTLAIKTSGGLANHVTMPTNLTATATSANRTVSFDEITFDAAGTYTFTIQETGAPEAGMTNDTAEHQVKVEVRENTDTGELTVVSVTYDGNQDSLTVTNTYDPADVSLAGETALKVTKAISGRDWLDSDKFKFTLANTTGGELANHVTMPTNLTATATSANPTATFDEITFDAAGTYTFTITEKEDSIAGMSYDTTIYPVTVVVEDDPAAGRLKVTSVTYDDNQDSLTVTNQYKTPGGAKATLTITGNKVLTGRDWKDSDTFSFTLAAYGETTLEAVANGEVKLPENNQAIANNTDAHQFTFDEITFNKTGTYQFVVSENKSGIGGITDDTTQNIVTVSVTDIYDGNLKAEITGMTGNGSIESGLIFTNVYQPANTSANIEISKVLSGRDMLAGEFAFTISEVDTSGNVISSTTLSGPAGSNGSEVTVGKYNVTFTEAGSRTFEIKEVQGSLGGITYDDTVYTVTLTAEDNRDGGFDITQTIVDQNNNDYTDIVFKNSYTTEPVVVGPSGQVQISGTKTVIDGDANAPYELAPGDFSFELVSGDQVIATATNDANGNFVFEDITYTVPGDYAYVVREVQQGKDGMSYDGTLYDVLVSVTDNGQGQLVASISVTKDGEPSEISFTNTYDPTEVKSAITGSKVLTGRDMVAGEFSFSLEATDDQTATAISNGQIVVPYATTTNTANGGFAFEDLTFKQAGVYRFTISEVQGNDTHITYDDTKYTVEATVTDQQGILGVVWTGHEEVSFTNQYTPTAGNVTIPSASKLLNGRDLQADEFTFVIEDTEGNIISTATNDAQGQVQFDSMHVNATGHYTYIVKEQSGSLGGIQYDTTQYTIEFDVTDIAGQLTAGEVTIYNADHEAVDQMTFTNTYTVQPTQVILGGTKKLDGRPLNNGEFSFVLKDSEGQIVQEVQNNENGFFTFDAITYTQVGEYVYTISEVPGDDQEITYDDTEYTVTVTITDDGQGHLVSSVDDYDIRFTNIYTQAELPVTPSTPEDGSGVQTSDMTPLEMWIGLMIVSAAGIGLTYVNKRRKI